MSEQLNLIKFMTPEEASVKLHGRNERQKSYKREILEEESKDSLNWSLPKKTSIKLTHLRSGRNRNTR